MSMLLVEFQKIKTYNNSIISILSAILESLFKIAKYK